MGSQADGAALKVQHCDRFLRHEMAVHPVIRGGHRRASCLNRA